MFAMVLQYYYYCNILYQNKYRKIEIDLLKMLFLYFFGHEYEKSTFTIQEPWLTSVLELITDASHLRLMAKFLDDVSSLPSQEEPLSTPLKDGDLLHYSRLIIFFSESRQFDLYIQNMSTVEKGSAAKEKACAVD